jgi:hypothetical protein
MDFDSRATLYWRQAGGCRVPPEKGTLRSLVGKVLRMPPTERERCAIVVGHLTYRRDEIEALGRHPEYARPDALQDALAHVPPGIVSAKQHSSLAT